MSVAGFVLLVLGCSVYLHPGKRFTPGGQLVFLRHQVDNHVERFDALNSETLGEQRPCEAEQSCRSALNI